MKYLIGCLNHAGATPQGYTLLSIPKQTWAVVSVIWEEGKDEDLHNTWQKIYAEWFPSTQYQHADCDFDLELYYGDRDASYGVEIWIPIAYQ